MAKIKNLIPKPSFIRRQPKQPQAKKQRLKYIAVLPSLITLINALSGFAAIGYIGRGPGIEQRFMLNRPGLTFFAIAGYMIIIAMIADMLDGRVARLSKSTSSFGGQLDSLSDAISFGVAPAYLMLRVVESKLRFFFIETPALSGFIGKFFWLCGAVYVCCAVIRLARFNVENEDDESAHMSFAGLPSPAAAGTIVSLVIFQEDLLPKIADRTEAVFRITETAIIWALPFVTLLAGILMVSRIRYPHVVNQYFKGKKAFSTFIWVVITVLLMVWNIQLAMVISFCGYAVWGLVRWVWYVLSGKNKALPQTEPVSEEKPDRAEP
jgi:CDP-diacylglycerol--serine O-phosphatidyltransferase